MFFAALVCLTAVFEIASAAGVVLDAHGFESSHFSTGAIVPQQGWRSAGAGNTSAVIQQSVFQSGNQALQVNRVNTSDRRWAVPLTGVPSQRFVIVEWDMRVSQSNTTGFGPFFGVEGYDDVGVFGLLGSLGVDAATGDVLYQIQGSGALVETSVDASFDDWHHYRLVFDFATSTYRGYFNNMQVATSGFVDPGLNQLTDADISAFAAGGDAGSQNATGIAYFDNFIVRDGLLGDYDLDGDVDAADFNVWKQSFGSAVTPDGNLADGSMNGVVDAADYTVWRNNLGSSLLSGSGSIAGSLTSAPEPSTIWLSMLSLSVLVARRIFGR